MLHYRIGYPLWKSLARRGMPMSLRVDILRDHEAGVFVATSRDLRGLVVEAESLDVLAPELQHAVDSLVREYLKKAPKHRPVTQLQLGSDSVFA